MYIMFAIIVVTAIVAFIMSYRRAESRRREEKIVAETQQSLVVMLNHRLVELLRLRATGEAAWDAFQELKRDALDAYLRYPNNKIRFVINSANLAQKKTVSG